MAGKAFYLKVAMICLLFYSSTALASDIHLVVAIHQQTTGSYMNIREVIRECAHSDTVPNAKNWFKPAIEFYLLCKSLRIGGLNPRFEFKIYPSGYRSSKDARDGIFIMRAFAPWLEDKHDKNIFYISDPVIQKGEVFVGVYTRPDHRQLLNVRTIDALQKFSMVSNKSWTIDWSTAACLNIAAYSVSTRKQMFQMVHAKRADFLLSAFSSRPDLSHQLAGIKLVPVPGIRIAFNHSRHFMVHKQFPEAKRVFNAIQKGLRVLRSKRQIRKLFLESGYFSSALNHWQTVRCADSAVEPIARQ